MPRRLRRNEFRARGRHAGGTSRKRRVEWRNLGAEVRSGGGWVDAELEVAPERGTSHGYRPRANRPADYFAQLQPPAPGKPVQEAAEAHSNFPRTVDWGRQRDKSIKMMKYLSCYFVMVWMGWVYGGTQGAGKASVRASPDYYRQGSRQRWRVSGETFPKTTRS